MGLLLTVSLALPHLETTFKTINLFLSKPDTGADLGLQSLAVHYGAVSPYLCLTLQNMGIFSLCQLRASVGRSSDCYPQLPHSLTNELPGDRNLFTLSISQMT